MCEFCFDPRCKVSQFIPVVGPGTASGGVMSATEAIYRETFRVAADVIDGNGHVNNVAYLKWMQDIAVAHFRTKISRDQMRDWGFIWVARSHHIEYLSPVFLDDEIQISTWIVDWRRVRSTRRYRMIRTSDQAIVAQGETSWVLVDTESGRPRSIPETIQSAFALCSDG